MKKQNIFEGCRQILLFLRGPQTGIGVEKWKIIIINRSDCDPKGNNESRKEISG
jgi:hypothetical protein